MEGRAARPYCGKGLEFTAVAGPGVPVGVGRSGDREAGPLVLVCVRRISGWKSVTGRIQGPASHVIPVRLQSSARRPQPVRTSSSGP
ncbi:hypothetical protein TH66_18850 [Carbonactinospora thermoautotrophica]|uniref:Uncharacterized protein n=1 Tax=Carbonactinospora thermoautotrophica TaxID=1469144 RepID=A0A132NED9_9ACTN|nr:hypothetical protein TH66_18850 [Carbonactinospora thermoautotrophica]KWX08505.1 hypothetical protein TR74_14740 [Carbonactinospora thermoautotrophica]